MKKQLNESYDEDYDDDYQEEEITKEDLNESLLSFYTIFFNKMIETGGFEIPQDCKYELIVDITEGGHCEIETNAAYFLVYYDKYIETLNMINNTYDYIASSIMTYNDQQNGGSIVRFESRRSMLEKFIKIYDDISKFKNTVPFMLKQDDYSKRQNYLVKTDDGTIRFDFDQTTNTLVDASSENQLYFISVNDRDYEQRFCYLVHNNKFYKSLPLPSELSTLILTSKQFFSSPKAKIISYISNLINFKTDIMIYGYNQKDIQNIHQILNIFKSNADEYDLEFELKCKGGLDILLKGSNE